MSPEECQAKKYQKDEDFDDYQEPEDSGGAAASSANAEPSEPLLPLREDDEEELAEWLQELENGEFDYEEESHFLSVPVEVASGDQSTAATLTASGSGFTGAMTTEYTLPADVKEAVYGVLEEFQANGFPVDDVTIGVEGCLGRCHEDGANLQDDEALVFEVAITGATPTGIQREARTLTKEECMKHAKEVGKAKFKELVGLQKLGCFKRYPRKLAHNVVDGRWVITWKLVDGELVIKCRYTVRGFKDRQDAETFAGTATRSGQRVTNYAIACNGPDWVTFSFDVSQAFAKGLSFEELARATGEELREVEFSVNGEDVAFIRMLPGFEDFCPITEVLKILIPIYGLKDAPRAWRKCLHGVLTEFGLRSLLAEPELYVMHAPTGNVKKKVAAIEDRRKNEEATAQEVEQKVDQDWLQNHIRKLEMILSTHVDDLKGGASRKVAERLLEFLESKFGKCKNEWKKFMHTGIQHEQLENGIFCHQFKYIEELHPIDLSGTRGQDDEQEVGEGLHSEFSSLLGGVAWTVLTRAEIAIYVQALQRRSHSCRLKDCRRVNVVLRYLKRHKHGIMYPRLGERVRIIGFTDSAFKTQEGEGSGLALRGLAVMLANEIDQGQPVTTPGQNIEVNLLEWLVRRLRRVVRSTFAAELNALIDSIETLLLLQLVLHQVHCGTAESPDELLFKLEHGGLYPPIDLLIDAQSVSDAIAAPDVCTPQEASLKLHLIAIRDRLARGLLRSVSWSDTRDMVADALTKGGIDRTVIVRAMSGHLCVQHEVKTTWGRR